MREFPLENSEQGPLSPDEQLVFNTVMRSAGHGSEQENAYFENLLLSHLKATRDIDLTHYVKTNSPLRAQFTPRIISDADRNAQWLLTHSAYGKRQLTPSIAGQSIVLDAPFAYFMQVCTDPHANMNKWETISVVSYRPIRPYVLIDQIQSSNTMFGANHERENTLRKMFKKGLPVFALCDAVKQFAKHEKFEYIGIRQSKYNTWSSVHERAEAGEQTIYDTMTRQWLEESLAIPAFPEYIFMRVTPTPPQQ